MLQWIYLLFYSLNKNHCNVNVSRIQSTSSIANIVVVFFTFWWKSTIFPAPSLWAEYIFFILKLFLSILPFFFSLSWKFYYPQRCVGRVIQSFIMWLLDKARTNKPDLTHHFPTFFLCSPCPKYFLIISPKNIVCLYLHPVLNPPGQHPEVSAKPLLFPRLRQTFEIELLFSDVRSSASACGISTGNALPWQGLALVAHVAQRLQCHTDLVVEGCPQWRYRLATVPGK